jgi:hypothetical protein
VTTAPAPERYNRLNTSKEIPRIPDASIAGLSNCILPTEVARLGSIRIDKSSFEYNS